MEGRTEKFGAVCFVDVAYVLKSTKGFIDYVKMRSSIQRHFKVRFDDFILYNSEGSYSPDEYYAKMEELGLTVKVFDLKQKRVCCRICGYKELKFVQKGVDVAIVTDMLSKAFRGEYHTAILIAGDGDFAPAISVIRGTFRKVFVVGYCGSISKDLENAATGVLKLSDIQ